MHAFKKQRTRNFHKLRNKQTITVMCTSKLRKAYSSCLMSSISSSNKSHLFFPKTGAVASKRNLHRDCTIVSISQRQNSDFLRSQSLAHRKISQAFVEFRNINHNNESKLFQPKVDHTSFIILTTQASLQLLSLSIS